MIGNGRTQHTVQIFHHHTITKEHPQTHTEPSDGERGEKGLTRERVLIMGWGTLVMRWGSSLAGKTCAY
jgi:hypothetical protein